ncbi:MAG TPA: hypothetical protein DIT25_04590 [Candidatus Moranbacteria bacterium]|nr:hypothetical protein [Candidatus Moranbacteria bacterium]
MLPAYLRKQIKNDDLEFRSADSKEFKLPKYGPETHYIDLTKSGYFRALITLRHYVKSVSDYYFGVKCNAKNVDLFMLTTSVSSPMGPGSDSESIAIKFGKHKTNLVDSSQFGFEPLLLNETNKMFYCYLPSMRGEKPNKRHLNQFFHCEAEIKGEIKDIMNIIEGYIKVLAEALLLMPNIMEKISLDPEASKFVLKKILKINKFPEITFDRAAETLIKSKNKNLINFSNSGRDLSADGEIRLAETLKIKSPFWIRNYDRDRVPFYQKPDPQNPNKVINADMIFPPIIKNAFGGEIVGCGQRQNKAEELLDSLNRQKIDAKPYNWYINLRNLPGYNITSGFGLGIERFVTWALCRDDIKDAILYPRLKNIKSYP